MTPTQNNIRSGLICSREGRTGSSPYSFMGLWAPIALIGSQTCLRDGVTVAVEIMVGKLRVGGRGSYRGYLGWNTQIELAFAGRTGTTEESRAREGGLVKSIPPHQDG